MGAKIAPRRCSDDQASTTTMAYRYIHDMRMAA
jgi:hypothetical protein